MSSASRLWRILRAQLGAQVRQRLSEDLPFEVEFRWKGFRGAGDQGDPGQDGAKQGRSEQGSTGRSSGSAGRQGGGRRSAPGGPGLDPELARYYANLEVPYGSDLETVERAWKRLLRKYHPDRHATDPDRQRIANDLVKELNRAYAELKRRLERKSA